MVSVRNKKEEVAPTFQPLLSGGATTSGVPAPPSSAGRGGRQNFRSLNSERLPRLSDLLIEESAGFKDETNLKKPFKGFTEMESQHFLPKLNTVSKYLVRAKMNPKPSFKRWIPLPATRTQIQKTTEEEEDDDIIEVDLLPTTIINWRAKCSTPCEVKGGHFPKVIQCRNCLLFFHCQVFTPNFICSNCTEKDLAKKKNLVKKSSLPEQTAPSPKTTTEVKVRVSAPGGYLSRVRYTNANGTMVVKEFSIRKTKQPIEKLTKIDTHVEIIRSNCTNNCVLKRLQKNFPFHRRSLASKASSSASSPFKIPKAPPPMTANKTAARTFVVASSSADATSFTMVRPAASADSHNQSSASYQEATMGLSLLSSVAIQSCPP